MNLARSLQLGTIRVRSSATADAVAERIGAPRDDPTVALTAAVLASVTATAWQSMRMGEMLALTQDCIDYRSGNVTIWENDWHGQVGSTKGGERRTVPMTPRLRAALQAIRHLRGDLVLCGEDGSRWTKHMVRAALRTICKRAGLRVVGSRQVRHIIADISPSGGDPKASIQRRKPAIAAGNIQHSAFGQLTLRQQLSQKALFTPVDPGLIQGPIPLLLIALRVVPYAASDVFHLSGS